MTTPVKTGPITTQTSTPIGKIPGDRQGATLLVSGAFNGSTVNVSYQAADGSFVNFTGANSVLTATGQISVTAGNNLALFLTTSVANPTGINVITTYF